MNGCGIPGAHEWYSVRECTPQPLRTTWFTGQSLMRELCRCMGVNHLFKEYPEGRYPKVFQGLTLTSGTKVNYWPMSCTHCVGKCWHANFLPKCRERGGLLKHHTAHYHLLMNSVIQAPQCGIQHSIWCHYHITIPICGMIQDISSYMYVHNMETMVRYWHGWAAVSFDFEIHHFNIELCQAIAPSILVCWCWFLYASAAVEI